MFDDQIELILTDKWYPEKSPFNPPEKYPEYPYDEIDENNHVYSAVRDLLIKLKLDEKNYGTKEWNPLGKIIKPGDKVVLKPNFVSEPRSNDADYKSIITHSSIIRPIIDYCQIALQGEGELVIADAPQFDSNFEEIKKVTQIENVIYFINTHSKIKVNLIDLRQELVKIENGIITQRIQLNGDPKGYTVIDLGEESAFNSIEEHSSKIYGSDYDFEETRMHHSDGKHEYCVSNTILDADVIINIPKLKTHKKAGITVCLKNLVGINTNKNYLPHFRFGSKEEGGDEYPESTKFKGIMSNLGQYLLKLLAKMNSNQRKVIKPLGNLYLKMGSRNPLRFKSGNWHGNDTIWRTVIDLNKILFFAKKDGSLSNEIQREYLSIVDGIIGGERDGPIFPTCKPCGLIIGGFDPVSVDLISAEIMGFDWRKIPTIKNAKEMLFNNVEWSDNKLDINLKFSSPPEWEYIKLN